MYYALSGAHINLIWGEIQHMHWGWVSFAIVATVLLFLLQSWRWALILRPVERVTMWTCTRALYIGLFANEVLPLRAGELIRCFLITRWSSVPLSVSFASALIERIFDGIWLMICFFLTLRMATLPHIFERGGYILGVIIVVAALIIGFGMYAKEQSVDTLFGFSFPSWFETLVADLHLIGHSRYLYYSFFISGAFLLAQMFPIYAVIRGYRLETGSPWIISFALMVLLRLSSVVPQAPGNLGIFQGIAFRTLVLFGVSAAISKRFSFVLWGVATIPLIVMGFLILILSGIKMRHLRREAMSAAEVSKTAK
jgi:uncharacterized membrane protein YbhN (UPF0104 family)